MITRVLTRGRRDSQSQRNVTMETEIGKLDSEGGGRRVDLLCYKVGPLVPDSIMQNPVWVREHTARTCSLVDTG